MSRSRPQKVKTVQSVQPVIVMDDDDLDDDGNGDVPVDILSGDQDYDDVILQNSETNDTFLDGGLCSDVQDSGGGMVLDNGSGDQMVEESVTSGSGLADPVTSTRGDGPYNLRPRPQCSTRFRDFVMN
ncbi:hypothetical protein NDU88_004902 [Pleurodeles waltl]|uniref:Uncharacterized protein n=1 Tax=Pleurodeles waltl TaxID=8319 RepID=A0AAV7PEE6_PLEWA|nr:hypothetical protein NDU88_002699 [Pleurodeles waltl]KAJ1126495.1 hypothetical protein NDU88_004902 [Pleurodeles waltl]